MSNVIELSGIGLQKDGKVILDGIDLCIESGQCCAVIGPNGSGKSSLISIIAGYQWPSEGSVHFCGQTYGEVSLADVRSEISLITTSRVPEFDSNITAWQVVATGLFETIRLPITRDLTEDETARVDDMVKMGGLCKLAGRSYHCLSTGERMNTLICRSLMKKPKLLVLDEPTLGLDIRNRESVIRNLSNLQKDADGPAVLIVTHHLSELPENVDMVCMLKDGRFMAKDLPRNILNSDKLTELFDWPIEVRQIAGRFYARGK
ncbi:MAG: ABC transporter ATP-binding protein [Sedimentisphaeraceae bacterium JB056]